MRKKIQIFFSITFSFSKIKSKNFFQHFQEILWKQKFKYFFSTRFGKVLEKKFKQFITTILFKEFIENVLRIIQIFFPTLMHL